MCLGWVPIRAFDKRAFDMKPHNHATQFDINLRSGTSAVVHTAARTRLLPTEAYTGAALKHTDHQDKTLLEPTWLHKLGGASAYLCRGVLPSKTGVCVAQRTLSETADPNQTFAGAPLARRRPTAKTKRRRFRGLCGFSGSAVPLSKALSNKTPYFPRKPTPILLSTTSRNFKTAASGYSRKASPTALRTRWGK